MTKNQDQKHKKSKSRRQEQEIVEDKAEEARIQEYSRSNIKKENRKKTLKSLRLKVQASSSVKNIQE